MRTIHYPFIAFLSLALGVLSATAATWDPSGWEKDTSKSTTENLNDLLTHLEERAAEHEEFEFLEIHFRSIRLLVDAYPPSSQQINDLLETYSDPSEGAAWFRYNRGDRQLVIAYPSSATGQLSYVRYTLPYRWMPGVKYPVYVWLRGGGSTPYPGDIHTVFSEQVRSGPIEGTPSGVYKDGYTVMPGALGGRAYTGDQELDFIEGLDQILETFDHNPNRLYLGGFSNGGKGTYLIASATREKYNWAALGMCAPAVNSNQAVESIASKLIGIPIWMAVGADDTRWKPNTHATRDILTAVGNPPEVYFEQPGVGHQWSWDFQLGMYEFLKSKSYSPPQPPPATLSIHLNENGPKLIITPTDTLNATLEFSTNLSDWSTLETINSSSLEPQQRDISQDQANQGVFYRLNH